MDIEDRPALGAFTQGACVDMDTLRQVAADRALEQHHTELVMGWLHSEMTVLMQYAGQPDRMVRRLQRMIDTIEGDGDG